MPKGVRNELWTRFNAWYLDFLDGNERRPTSDELSRWHRTQGPVIWPDESNRPSLADCKDHAKGIRSRAKCRAYFRTYRRGGSKKKKRRKVSDDDDGDDEEVAEEEEGVVLARSPVRSLRGPSLRPRRRRERSPSPDLSESDPDEELNDDAASSGGWRPEDDEGADAKRRARSRTRVTQMAASTGDINADMGRNAAAAAPQPTGKLSRLAVAGFPQDRGLHAAIGQDGAVGAAAPAGGAAATGATVAAGKKAGKPRRNGNAVAGGARGKKQAAGAAGPAPVAAAAAGNGQQRQPPALGLPDLNVLPAHANGAATAVAGAFGSEAAPQLPVLQAPTGVAGNGDLGQAWGDLGQAYDGDLDRHGFMKQAVHATSGRQPKQQQRKPRQRPDASGVGKEQHQPVVEAAAKAPSAPKAAPKAGGRGRNSLPADMQAAGPGLVTEPAAQKQAAPRRAVSAPRPKRAAKNATASAAAAASGALPPPHFPFHMTSAFAAAGPSLMPLGSMQMQTHMQPPARGFMHPAPGQQQLGAPFPPGAAHMPVGPLPGTLFLPPTTGMEPVYRMSWPGTGFGLYGMSSGPLMLAPFGAAPPAAETLLARSASGELDDTLAAIMGGSPPSAGRAVIGGANEGPASAGRAIGLGVGGGEKVQRRPHTAPQLPPLQMLPPDAAAAAEAGPAVAAAAPGDPLPSPADAAFLLTTMKAADNVNRRSSLEPLWLEQGGASMRERMRHLGLEPEVHANEDGPGLALQQAAGNGGVKEEQQPGPPHPMEQQQVQQAEGSGREALGRGERRGRDARAKSDPVEPKLPQDQEHIGGFIVRRTGSARSLGQGAASPSGKAAGPSAPLPPPPAATSNTAPPQAAASNVLVPAAPQVPATNGSSARHQHQHRGSAKPDPLAACKSSVQPVVAMHMMQSTHHMPPLPQPKDLTCVLGVVPAAPDARGAPGKQPDGSVKHASASAHALAGSKRTAPTAVSELPLPLRQKHHHPNITNIPREPEMLLHQRQQQQQQQLPANAPSDDPKPKPKPTAGAGAGAAAARAQAAKPSAAPAGQAAAAAAAAMANADRALAVCNADEATAASCGRHAASAADPAGGPCALHHQLFLHQHQPTYFIPVQANPYPYYSNTFQAASMQQYQGYPQTGQADAQAAPNQATKPGPSNGDSQKRPHQRKMNALTAAGPHDASTMASARPGTAGYCHAAAGADDAMQQQAYYSQIQQLQQEHGQQMAAFKPYTNQPMHPYSGMYMYDWPNVTAAGQQHQMQYPQAPGAYPCAPPLAYPFVGKAGYVTAYGHAQAVGLYGSSTLPSTSAANVAAHGAYGPVPVSAAPATGGAAEAYAGDTGTHNRRSKQQVQQHHQHQSVSNLTSHALHALADVASAARRSGSPNDTHSGAPTGMHGTISTFSSAHVVSTLPDAGTAPPPAPRPMPPPGLGATVTTNMPGLPALQPAGGMPPAAAAAIAAAVAAVAGEGANAGVGAGTAAPPALMQQEQEQQGPPLLAGAGSGDFAASSSGSPNSLINALLGGNTPSPGDIALALGRGLGSI